MGMSASQARLLAITSRINDVELKSQQIANTKLRLADESEQVANAYTKALSKQKLTMTSYASGTAQTVNLTLNELNKPGSPFKLVSRSGKKIVSPTIFNNFKKTMEDVYNKYTTMTPSADSSDYTKNMCNNEKQRNIESRYVFTLLENFGVTSWDKACEETGIDRGSISSTDPFGPFIDAGLITRENVEYCYAQFDEMFATQTTNSDGTKNADSVMSLDSSCYNDANWLYEAIQSGEFMLVDTSGNEVSISSNTQLAIQNDDSGLARAEAEYNAETAKINRKEKLLDNDLKALDTEHSALTTEFDSVKSLIGDNVEKSFNLFS